MLYSHGWETKMKVRLKYLWDWLVDNALVVMLVICMIILVVIVL